MNATKMLPVPPFYDAAHAAQSGYAPDEGKLFAEASAWRSRHDLAPAAADACDVHLLLIDVQKDFCFPEGSLYVGGRSGRGAVEDTRRLCAFIYRNAASLSRITASMDTHLAFQIFFPAFWVDREGRTPAPHRVVAAADVRSGALRPSPAVARWLAQGDEEWLAAEVLHYCESLEREGRYQLYLWPPHCLLGGDGHALAGPRDLDGKGPPRRAARIRTGHGSARGAPGGHPEDDHRSPGAPAGGPRDSQGGHGVGRGPSTDRGHGKVRGAP